MKLKKFDGLKQYDPMLARILYIEWANQSLI